MTQSNFHIQTFGCQMNVNDSDWLSRSLVARGFQPSSFETADIYVLNTCSVRDKPEQKVYSELGRIANYCKVHDRRNILVCVGGCVAQQVGAALAKRFPQVRLLFGTDGIAGAPAAIERLVAEPNLRLNLLDFVEHYEERLDTWHNSTVPPAVFVNIMQGCNNFCTYCIVPYVRGRQKSRSFEAIVTECSALVAQGAREITLLGQNVNSYGLDGLVQGITFADLVQEVSAIAGLARLRFVTPHPKDMAPEVIAAFGANPKVCPRLHLPLQSGSDRILKKMGRRYTAEEYLALVERLRAACPEILFSTDIIVGFPGETDEDFAATMAVMEQVGYVSSFSFIYSDRPHAKAVLLPDKIARPVALERLAHLQAWQETATARILETMRGTTVPVLIETQSQRPMIVAEEHAAIADEFTPEAGQEEEYWQGKTPQGITVNIRLARRRAGSWLGAILPVFIEDAGRHALKGRQAGEAW